MVGGGRELGRAEAQRGDLSGLRVGVGVDEVEVLLARRQDGQGAEREGAELEAGVVLPALDISDGLVVDAACVGQSLKRQSALGSQDREPAF